jgi:NADPH-dependent curcumin reductase CurA
VPWEVAGSLAIAGSTAYASVRAISLKGGDTVAISAAAGGVGSIAVQLATRAGAAVIGIASPANHEWLAAHGVKPEKRTASIDYLRCTYNHRRLVIRHLEWTALSMEWVLPIVGCSMPL